MATTTGSVTSGRVRATPFGLGVPLELDAPAAVGARLVHTVDDHRKPIAGARPYGSTYAFTREPPTGQPSLEILDIDSGVLRRFTLPSDREEIGPDVMYVTDTEAMIDTGAAGTRQTPMRIDITALPTVPRGRRD